METWKKIVMWSSDKKNIFIVEEEVMLQAKTIKNMLEIGCFSNDKIPVMEVDNATLSKVVDYCNMHALNKDPPDLDAWDANFANVDLCTLFDLMRAANYLCIESLSDLLLQCLSLANTINERSVEEMCETFKIE